jgi:hypothetical protein
LEKEPLKNYHINWIGSIYKEKVLDKKWEDKREIQFWAGLDDDRFELYFD